MTATATLDGYAVARLRLQFPAWGLWWADVDLVDGVELEGGVVLDVAGTTCAGAIVSGGAVDGSARYRVVGGAGGWGRDVAAKAYRNTVGVKRSTVLGDLASAVGETVEGAPTSRVGQHYARPAAPATQTLEALAPRGWYVGLDGVTRFGARASTTYTGNATRTREDKRLGVVELAVGGLVVLPGAAVDDFGAASDVEYVLADKRLTARVYAGASGSRRLAAWARLLEAIDPRRRYRATYDFRVITSANDRLTLQPVRSSSGLPILDGVSIRGPWGVKATATPGAVVAVTFADADPSRPFVVAGPAWDDPGWLPATTELGPTPRLGVARMTDAVVAGAFGGTIVGGSLTVKAGL